jgi:hypothetical protein
LQTARGRLAEAIACHDKSRVLREQLVRARPTVAFKSRLAESYIELGNCLVASRRFAEALRSYQRCLALVAQRKTEPSSGGEGQSLEPHRRLDLAGPAK